MKVTLTNKNMVQLTAESHEESITLYSLLEERKPKEKKRKKMRPYKTLAQTSPEVIDGVKQLLRNGESVYGVSKQVGMSTYKVEKIKNRMQI